MLAWVADIVKRVGVEEVGKGKQKKKVLHSGYDTQIKPYQSFINQ